MDLLKTIRSGHSKIITDRIVKYVGNDPEKFSRLLKIFLGDDRRTMQRAGWPLGDIGSKYPELPDPHYAYLISRLSEQGHHPAVYRNILRIFEKADIPEDFCGQVIDLAFNFIRDEKQTVAVRAFAITVASNICKKYPELKNEFRIILKVLQEQEQTPALKVRIRRAAI